MKHSAAWLLVYYGVGNGKWELGGDFFENTLPIICICQQINLILLEVGGEMGCTRGIEVGTRGWDILSNLT